MVVLKRKMATAIPRETNKLYDLNTVIIEFSLMRVNSTWKQHQVLFLNISVFWEFLMLMHRKLKATPTTPPQRRWCYVMTSGFVVWAEIAQKGWLSSLHLLKRLIQKHTFGSTCVQWLLTNSSWSGIRTQEKQN